MQYPPAKKTKRSQNPTPKDHAVMHFTRCVSLTSRVLSNFPRRCVVESTSPRICRCAQGRLRQVHRYLVHTYTVALVEQDTNWCESCIIHRAEDPLNVQHTLFFQYKNNSNHYIKVSFQYIFDFMDLIT